VVQEGAPLVVADARSDERLRDTSAIGEFDAVAYAGYPLRTPDGDVLGALCVIDSPRRSWTADELTTVADLAEAAAVEVGVPVTYVSPAAK
jgi:GAF domain-containing protein